MALSVVVELLEELEFVELSDVLVFEPEFEELLPDEELLEEVEAGVGVGGAAIWIVVVCGISWLPLLSVAVIWIVVVPELETVNGFVYAWTVWPLFKLYSICNTPAPESLPVRVTVTGPV